MGDCMKNKRSGSFLDKFDFPEDLREDGYHIEIFRSCAVVDGCKNIAQYSDGIIRLNTKKDVVSVIGNNLTVRSMNNAQVTVDGHITSVEISGR